MVSRPIPWDPGAQPLNIVKNKWTWKNDFRILKHLGHVTYFRLNNLPSQCMKVYKLNADFLEFWRDSPQTQILGGVTTPLPRLHPVVARTCLADTADKNILFLDCKNAGKCAVSSLIFKKFTGGITLRPKYYERATAFLPRPSPWGFGASRFQRFDRNLRTFIVRPWHFPPPPNIKSMTPAVKIGFRVSN